MTSQEDAQRLGFKTGEAIVYPAHGVGRITAIEEQEIAGYKLELFVVSFEKDKMVLRVPTAKANMRRHAQARRAGSRQEVPRRRSPAAPASSARCGRAAPRNTRPRSIPAT